MHKIIFNHSFIYLDDKGKVIRKVPCTAKELILSAESIKKDLGAYEVKKYNNITKKFIN